MWRLIPLLGWLLATAASADSPPQTRLRYDLRPGDRLVYRQTLERQVRPSDRRFARPESTSRLSWTNHLLVLDTVGDRHLVGFSRVRQSAELLDYRENGRSRLDRERPRFAEAWEEIPRVSVEANIVSDEGRASLPWRSDRERKSEILIGLHEIEPLPTEPVGPGDGWPGTYPLGLAFRVVDLEQGDGADCLRVAGSSRTQDFRMGYRFCPSDGAIRSADFEGSYFGIQARIRESWSIELLRRERGETIADWLERPELRLAVLAALSVGEASVNPRVLHDLLSVDDPEVQKQALALFHRRRLPLPPRARLEALLGSDRSRVRTLAARLLRDDPPTEDRSIDLHDEGVLGELPDWVCADPPGWSERIRSRLRFPRETPGTTWRRMRSEGLGGWGYSVYVPEDYRGDEPYPLLIYLAGGHGRPLLAISGAQPVIEREGYLVLFPQSDGYWWTEHSTEIVTALLDETLRGFNVDTNRVYLAGFSNGGTGTLHFATLWPHRLAGASSMMGAGAFPPEGSSPLLLNVAELPTQWIHGKRDEVIPWQSSRDTVRRLARVAPDARVEEHYLAKREHDLWLGSDDELVLGFFADLTRDPFPRRVALQLADLTLPRRYWIEVLEKAPGVAEVRGTIGPDNTIVLETRRVRKLRLLLRRDLLPAPDDGLRVVLDGRPVFEGPLVPDCDLIRSSWSRSADPFLAHSMALTVDAGG